MSSTGRLRPHLATVPAAYTRAASAAERRAALRSRAEAMAEMRAGHATYGEIALVFHVSKGRVQQVLTRLARRQAAETYSRQMENLDE